MAGLFNTTMDLARLRQQWRRNVPSGGAAFATGSGRGRGGEHLSELTGFGSNPGQLRMFAYVPEMLPADPALVVVLHGCTQDAAGYDVGAGWSTLAERYGFVLVLPQQGKANNPNACFNWFQPSDTARGSGEVLSIRQMVEHAVTLHGIDRRRIFVTGLSAGGAMTAALLAAYPELFAAGGIVAGLPYGCARNVQEALRAMFEPKSRPASEWGDLVRAASPHAGPWPRLSVWHGDADTTVTSANGREIVRQWANVHGIPAEPSARSMVDGHPREVWRDSSGREVIESFTIAGMAHGTPLHVGDGEGMAGAAGPYLLDVGISSSYHIARFWGLVPASEQDSRIPTRPAPAKVAGPATLVEGPRAEPGRLDVGSIIKDALRAAGLMKH